MSFVYITHGHRLAQGGAEGAAGDLPDLGLAGGVVDLHVGAGGGLHARNAHALAGLGLELALGREELVGAQEALFLSAAALRPAHGPGQCGLHGVGAAVDVVTVQAQPRLQAQGVTGTQPSRVNGAVLEQGLGQRDSRGGGYRELEPVLPGVATARHPAPLNAGNGGVHARHEVHLGQIQGHQGSQHLCCSSTLQGEQLQVLHVGHGAVPGEVSQVLVEVLHVPHLAGTVHHHVDVVSSVGDNGVIHDATILVCDETQATFTRAKSLDITHNHLFKEVSSILSIPSDLTHVGYIKKCCFAFFAAPKMFFLDATILSSVLHWQFIASKWHHLSP
mmetsp:Transcript_1190/g.1588  ORF Transcript_1190/g.1588 Transcript_1190/m.1588 type:complete len:333 (-) Transcript_1190:231-1229(-)